MSKINLIIFPGNFLPHIGGLETHVDEFSKYLSQNKNYNITIFTPDIMNAKPKETIHKKVKVIRYPAFELIPNYPIAKFWRPVFYRFFLSLYKQKYDIVMTRTRFFSNSFLGLLFAKVRLKKIKLIHVEHGSSYVLLESKFKTKIAYFYDKIIGKLILQSADKIIAISKTSHKFLTKEFERTREIPIIRRGVDFEIYKKAKSDKSIETQFKGKIIMTFLGRLYKWKGVSQTIEAYKSLPDDLKNKSVLLIVGDGEDYNKLQEQAKEYFNNGIYFLGKVELQRAISILKSSDIYVHSAYPGGALSNSLLQAMICKCAIIASPNEGANEVVNEKTGILLNSNKIVEIKEAMITLIKDDKLRDSYSNEANKHIIKNFDWKKVITKYDKIMKEQV